MNKVLSVMCALMAHLAFATPVISDVKVTSIPPWGVVIDYVQTSTPIASDAKDASPIITAIDGAVTNVARSLSGDVNCLNGAHHIYWNMAKDGITSKATNGTIRISCPSFRYCIVDLSGGASVESYPVAYSYGFMGDYNTFEYTTTKLVLKRVDAGSFKMQNSTDVTLTKPFYMGLYEVTQKQWELVMGSNPCSSTSYGEGYAYPVYYVSYNMIRGSSEGAKWPASNSVDSDSFLGKLRAKTGLTFDLPTEAQWEYTCRAGTTTRYSYGDSANGNYMWYYDNSSYGTQEVGMLKANPWGFYDMYGNVEEWCLDWYDLSLSGGEDPKGSSSGSHRVTRGGSWYDGASGCSSSIRGGYYPSSNNYGIGFRLSRTLP